MQCIYIHGLGQNSSSWDKTISCLTKSDQVISLDLMSMLNRKEAVYVNLYRVLVDYCNEIPGKLNLCGLSLGAILALNYAIDYPERVQSIVLIGAQYKMPKALLKFQNIIFRFMPKNSFMKMGFQKEEFIKLTNSMLDLDFSGKLKDISCASLIVCGEKDNANRKAAKNLTEGIPNAEFHLAKNAGHEVNIDTPKELADTLNHFYHTL